MLKDDLALTHVNVYLDIILNAWFLLTLERNLPFQFLTQNMTNCDIFKSKDELSCRQII